MLLALWDDGVWQDAALIAGIALASYGLVLWVAALVWTYRDITARTRDQFTQAVSLVIVIIFNLPGLLLYLVMRPKDTMADVYDRQLEAEALLHEIQEQSTCPACRRKVESDFIACPYCRSQLRTPCASCGKPMATTWVLCPFCGTDRTVAPPDRTPRPMRAEQPERAPESSPTTAAAPATRPARMRRPSTATYTPPAAKPAAAPDAAADPGS